MPASSATHAHERRALAVRRPEERGTHAEVALERVLRALQLGVARVEPAPLVVVVRVVADELAVVGRALATTSGRASSALPTTKNVPLRVVAVEDGAPPRASFVRSARRRT